MPYKDYNRSTNRATTMKSDAVASKLMEATIDRVFNLGYFYYVGAKIREGEAPRSPACIVMPVRIEVAEQALPGGRFDYRYIFDIAFFLKQHSDCVLLQQALFLHETVRDAFSIGDNGQKTLVFADATGHYNTDVILGTIEPVEEVSNNVLAYSSGINIMYSVWRTIT